MQTEPLSPPASPPPSRPPARETKRKIRPRAMGFPFLDSEIPRWWFFNHPRATHASNALNLLFPDGERFFIRSVKHYMAQIEEDPELLEEVRGFFGQEGRHGHEHERFFKVLRGQGYDIDSFLEIHRKIAYGWLEPRTAPVVRLAATVALEHFTASLADNVLRDNLLDHAHPVMADLLRWHAAEEIEHKAVAFKVLKKVDPRYSVRMAGLAYAVVTLFGFWIAATMVLMRQDELSPEERRRMDELWQSAEAHRRLKTRRAVFGKAILDYLRPDFDPDDHDNYELARSYLSSIGRA